MKKRKMKAKKVSIDLDEFKRHTGALAEHFDDGLKVIGDGLASLRESTEARFVEVNQTLGSHTQMLAQVMMDVEQIKFDLKQKVSYDDFAKLEKRVMRLEIKSHT